MTVSRDAREGTSTNLPRVRHTQQSSVSMLELKVLIVERLAAEDACAACPVVV